ncbi:MAG TPA: divalent-cation tolerance protein CutA [Terrimicrobiaceae bacterium]
MIRLVLTTFANAEDAAKAVRTLVDEKIIACGTILPGARSIYRWKDAVEDAGEAVVSLKTSVEGFPRLEQRLREIHPYETPEIVAIDPSAVSKPYADWVLDCVSGHE